MSETYISILEKRLERERASRRSAEEIAEVGLRDLYQKNQQLLLLASIATQLTKIEDINDKYNSIFDLLCNYLKFDFGRICFFDTKVSSLFGKPVLFPVQYSERHVEFLNAIQDKNNKGIFNHIDNQAKILVKNVIEFSCKNLKELANRVGVIEAISIPISINEKVAATFEFYSSSPIKIENILEILPVQFADQISIHLERELIRKQHQLDLSSDLLTGLANRRTIHEKIDKIILKKEKTQEFKSILLVFGFDNFRYINDSYGYHVGDLIIQEGADYIKDIISKLSSDLETTIGRIAGDEYAIIIENVADISNIKFLGNEIVSFLSNQHPVFENISKFTLSGGMLVIDKQVKTSFQALNDADIALQNAKKDGGARIEVFDELTRRNSYQTRSMAIKLNHGLVKDDFLLYFQPLISVKDKSLTGFEALIRWKNSDGSLISPDEFLPIAYRAGMTKSIGNWVIRKCFEFISSIQEQIEKYQTFKIGINISPSHFKEEYFGKEIVDLVKEYNVNPNWVCLEIVESTLVENISTVIKNFKILKENGVNIAIDDFGTGYSSLSYLQRYKPDIIKIDKEFIINISEKVEQQKIVSALVNMAKSIDILIVAEGVESEEDLNYLELIGCDFAQGYLFSKPVPEIEVQLFLKHKKFLLDKMQGNRLI